MENVKTVQDSKGFVYEINIIHKPENGHSYAEHKGEQVAKMNYGQYILPQGDDDKEWEEFEERFYEGFGAEIEDRLVYDAKQHFDNKVL